MRWKRFRKWVLRPILAILLLPAGFLAWNHSQANFGTVAPGSVYRSGQMSSTQLAKTLRERGIKTVLNLRGSHPEDSWYRAERDATLAAGATQVDVALSSCEWMSRAQAQALVEILENSPRPLLIHCFHGSERTGIVSAFSRLLAEDGNLAEAQGQFSLAHLYVAFGDGVVTARHLEQYADWLAKLGEKHSPTVFKRWVKEGYRPGSPSREEWPFDPYPLKVVTKPVSDPGQRFVVETEWTPGSEPGSPRRAAGNSAPVLR